MKKLLSIILALALVLAMGTAALAAESANVTIADSEGRTYNGYKILELTTSLKTGEHHPENCDGNHTGDCYNYAYTVNAKYRTILQEEVFANGGNYLWEETTKPAASTGVTDDQILKYLSNQTSDDGDVYKTMRQVADRLYRAILAGAIEADAKNMTGTNDSIAQGYWMFADVTDLSGNAANSLVMVDTKGQDALTINPKTALPVLEKKVKDIDDSEDSNIADNAWHDSADHDIGDTIPFKLTGTLASNSAYYTTYEMVFHDSMSAGLTFKAETVKVYMYDTKHRADVDTDLNDYLTGAAKDVTDKFVLTTTDLEEGCTFELGCENVLAIDGVTKDSAFVVYYEATLNNSAVIGAEGNPNTATLEFSNDPYGTGTGETEEDLVKVFTYKLVINKTDSHGHALSGAGFTLYKKLLGSDDQYVAIGGELGGKDNARTTFVWEGLDDGDYKLVESTVPEGYNKMSDVVFAISAVHSETSGTPVLTELDGGLMGVGTLADGVLTGAIEKNIVNNTGTILPETGAEGTMMLIGGGAVLVILAAIFMITRKKMSVYEG